MIWFLLLNGQQCDQTNLTSPSLFFLSHFFPHLHSLYLLEYLCLVGVKKYLFSFGILILLFTKVFWSICHQGFCLFPSTNTSKFPKPNWDDDGSNNCFTICGCTSFYVIFVISPMLVIALMNFKIASAPSSFLLLNSWISTGSCVIIPNLVATLIDLLKIPLLSLSNSGFVVSSMSSTHLIVSLISFVNHFPSSHSNNDGDAKGEITFNSTMS